MELGNAIFVSFCHLQTLSQNSHVLVKIDRERQIHARIKKNKLVYVNRQ